MDAAYFYSRKLNLIHGVCTIEAHFIPQHVACSDIRRDIYYHNFPLYDFGSHVAWEAVVSTVATRENKDSIGSRTIFVVY